MSDSVWPHRHQPTRLSCPWDSPGKNTGVGCHFLLQCMKEKKWKWSRSVVSNSWRPHGLEPTRLLRPWDFPGKSTGEGCHHLLRHSILHKFKWENQQKKTIKNRDQSVSCPPKDGYDIRAVPNRQEGKALLVFGGGDWKTGEQGKSAEDYSALFLGWKS